MVSELPRASGGTFRKTIDLICTITYMNTLLGLTFPIALTLRASAARKVLYLLYAVAIPGFIYVHLFVLPGLQTSPNGELIWHGLFAYWVTISILVFGGALARGCRELKPFLVYFVVFVGAGGMHKVGIPALQPTLLGSILVQAFFFFFQGLSLAAWIWCLQHVVQIQDFLAANPVYTESPISREARKAAAASAESSSSSSGKKDPPCPLSRLKVLIMGNAPNVLTGRALGKTVDNFDHVVRFNGYTLKDPEYTGSKTTYHFANGRTIPDESVQAAMPLFNASLTHAAYLFFPKMTQADLIVSQITSTAAAECKAKGWFVEEPLLLRLCGKIRLPFFQVPSSGMVAIESFLNEERVEKVYLHGFSFFEGSKLHYFDEPVMQLVCSWLERFITHNPPLEKKWVLGLKEEGKVVFLPDAVVPVKEAEQPSTEHGGSNPSTPRSTKSNKDEKTPRRSPKGPNMFRLWEDAFPSQFSM